MLLNHLQVLNVQAPINLTCSKAWVHIKRRLYHHKLSSGSIVEHSKNLEEDPSKQDGKHLTNEDNQVLAQVTSKILETIRIETGSQSSSFSKGVTQLVGTKVGMSLTDILLFIYQQFEELL